VPTPANHQAKNPQPEADSKKRSGQDNPELLGHTLKVDSVSYLRRWLAAFDSGDANGRASARGSNSGAEAGSATLQNPDPDHSGRQKRWEEIGWEVFERKALLLAAARDLQDNGCSNPVKLAAADVFVEKAQKFLTNRGDQLYSWGKVTACCAVLVMLIVASFLTLWPATRFLGVTTADAKISNAYLAVVILKATTAGGFFAGIIYFLVSLSMAFFHEGTVLFSRRHSLRFGRLFVYLMSDRMKREDLEAVFNWNAEFSTAFRDIRADGIAKSPLLKLIEALSPAESIKAINELAKLAKSKQPDHEKSSTEE
jgi:hypothetical protein